MLDRDAGRRIAWAELIDVVAACAAAGLPVPSGSVVLHDRLRVRHGGVVHDVAYWVEPDGTVHATDPLRARCSAGEVVRLQSATIVAMQEIPSRELRNDTAGVLARVQGGEELTVTVNGKPVAHVVPIQRTYRRPIRRAELLHRLRTCRADPGLRDDLARLAGETTDDLGPIK